MNREIEERILVLFSIIRNGGAATKKIVLDYLIDNDYIKLVEKDKKILKSRNEPRWRNMLAYTRQHLKDEGYLESNRYNQWQINLNGYDYYLKTTEGFDKDYEFEYLSNDFLRDFTNVLFVSSNIIEDAFNDNLNNKNRKNGNYKQKKLM